MKICEMATTVWPANMMGKCKKKIQPIFELFINQKIESIEMGQTCKSKQLFWTVHNSNFQKLYLRWKFVKWPPLFGQQTWWGNEPGWWRKLWSTIPDRSLGTQGTPNVEDPAKANKFWATIHIYYIYKKTQNSALKTHPRNWNRDGFAVYVGTYLYVLCIYFNVRLRM